MMYFLYCSLKWVFMSHLLSSPGLSSQKNNLVLFLLKLAEISLAKFCTFLKKKKLGLWCFPFMLFPSYSAAHLVVLECYLLLIWLLWIAVLLQKNWNLFSVNVAMAGTGLYQLSRKIRFVPKLSHQVSSCSCCVGWDDMVYLSISFAGKITYLVRRKLLHNWKHNDNNRPE